MSTVNRNLVYFFGRAINPRDELVQELQTRAIFGTNFPTLTELRDVVLQNKPGTIIINADAFDETQLRSIANSEFLRLIQNFCVPIVLSKQSGSTAYRTLWYIGGASFVALPDVSPLELLSYIATQHDRIEGIAPFDFTFTLSSTSLRVNRGGKGTLVGIVTNVIGPPRRIDYFISGTIGQITASWNPPFCTLNCGTAFTINVGANAPIGSILLTAIAADISEGRDVRKSIPFTLIVTAIPEVAKPMRLTLATEKEWYQQQIKEQRVSLENNNTPCGC